MATSRFADFQFETRITDSDFTRLESEGRVKLTPAHRAAISNALKEYEFLRVLKQEGEGKALKKALIRLQKTTEQFVESTRAVQTEPGHIWEYLLAESGAKVAGVGLLLTETKELNRKVALSGRKEDFHLNSLLSRLADTFLQAGGKGTSISHGAKGRGGRFLDFAFAATKCLPERHRPHSKDALGVRWERVRKIQKTGKGRYHMWVGSPYPALAKPWFGKK